MPFNVTLILEKASNYNNVLREQVSVEKSAHRIQNNMISEDNIVMPRMSATAKEHAPNVSDDKNMNNKSKAVNEDKWFKPKKVHANKYFFKHM